MAKNPKRPKDPNKLAHSIMQMATGQSPSNQNKKRRKAASKKPSKKPKN
jgi:hypothetical protein